MKKVLLLGAVVAASHILLSADVTIPSTYDEVRGEWVGDVVALTNAIANIQAYDRIILSKGVYDLSPVTNAPMYSANGSGYGAALLCAKEAGVQILGATGSPADVILKAVDSQYRILCLNSNKSRLCHVTVMGGNASSAHISTYFYRRGGGVLLSSDSAVVSNCVFTANCAENSGGAVAGLDNSSATVQDCVFYGNNGPTSYGLVAQSLRLSNCVITNNKSFAEEANTWSCSIVADCKVYDSYFAHNRAGRTGGVSGGVAVDCTFMFNEQKNINGNNWGNPGGGGAYKAVLSNCTFYGNISNLRGGAVRGGRLFGCSIVSNRTLNASSAAGGGIYQAALVENCNVSSNYSISGGGIFECGNVLNSTIEYNTAKKGGGGYTSVLTGCRIAHNVATSYEVGNYGGAGGGIMYGAATNCVFRDNSCSSACFASVLKNCDIGDTSVNAKVIDSCVLQNIQNDRMPRAIGNVTYPDGYVTSNIYMISGARLMRNCLVTNCTWKSLPGNYVNSAMFTPQTTAITTRVENCSIVDNYYYLLGRDYGSSVKKEIVTDGTVVATNIVSAITNRLIFANTLLHSTRRGDRSDVSGLTTPNMVLSNCVFGSATSYSAPGSTVIVSRAELRLVEEGDAPYCPKPLSPLRGKGLILDWMADGTDIAGKPRLRDGVADVGCYQCWLNQPGLHVLFK